MFSCGHVDEKLALREGNGEFAEAAALLREAAVSAAEGKDDVLSAASWAQLLFVVGERQARLEEASVIRDLGKAAGLSA